MGRNLRGLSFYAILILVLMFALIMSNPDNNTMRESYGYSELLENIEDVERVELRQNVEIPTGSATVYMKNAETKTFFVPNVENLRAEMVEQGIKVYAGDVQRPSWLMTVLPSLIVLIAVVFLLFFIMNQAQGGGGGNRVMSFGKSRAKLVVDDKNKVTFKNVAGLEEEKEELEEVVEFLKSPRKFVELGARIPKGVLLVGPPGTGKTLLAKAVAGEAGVPFFSISGSDFVEMFVGVGASRVRDLFENAKKNAPCIVFIDEIDAVGRKRGAGLGGGHDEREQTLNQLLVEMDGFGINEGVIVVAATNRVDILDPALLRPGRFDRKVFVGTPDVKGREEILRVHAKGKPLSDEINLQEVAQTTAGFTGADLENLFNEAAIYAAREDKKVIEQSHMRRAFVKVAIGTEKKSRVISEKEKRITAYHEAGHGVIHHVLEDIDSVHSISIIPTGMAGGYTMPLPSKDTMYITKKKMEQEIIALLGGRAAEKLVLDDVTTGASNDIERASAIARNMVVKYGMSDVIGPIQFGNDSDEVFIGRDWGHTRNYGENIAGLIDSEIKRIVDGAFQDAINLLEKHSTVLHKTAALLIKKEKITGAEFEAIFEAEGYVSHKEDPFKDLTPATE
ncbi:ATP-dependent zinc metalloprotease FtsH [Anaerotalea alkaliphila]|uniref:ATP-dependent zinc metalloprotease FtsH n=1 Tax=Anaerotalea alkaliphila TaxID=2662126 RepID=A0A7X5HTM5_9FIRM|nr:ATP-dependent zinc metalloprotease FtsH [Anaerotalea alkaliphila]NDL66429.1 ATP-dependent zinc metalloprotease FtsH [Anaerotalea alkaliphila]